MGKSHYFVAQKKVKPGDLIKCNICGKEFRAYSSRSKYCSKECSDLSRSLQVKMWKSANRERVLSNNHKYYEKHKPPPKKRKKWKKRGTYTRPLPLLLVGWDTKMILDRDKIIKKELVNLELLNFQAFSVQRRIEQTRKIKDFYWGKRWFKRPRCDYIKDRLFEKEIYTFQAVENQSYHLRESRGTPSNINIIPEPEEIKKTTTFLSDILKDVEVDEPT